MKSTKATVVESMLLALALLAVVFLYWLILMPETALGAGLEPSARKCWEVDLVVNNFPSPVGGLPRVNGVICERP